MTAMVERNRKAITDELHVMYKKQGRADYAARLGELYCLIASMEVRILCRFCLILHFLVNEVERSDRWKKGSGMLLKVV